MKMVEGDQSKNVKTKDLMVKYQNKINLGEMAFKTPEMS